MNWPELRRLAKLRNPNRICHLCGVGGGDFLDHKTPGDDHSIDNLDWAHDRAAPHCHRSKSGREGAQAANRIRRGRLRPPEPHPGLA